MSNAHQLEDVPVAAAIIKTCLYTIMIFMYTAQIGLMSTFVYGMYRIASTN